MTFLYVGLWLAFGLLLSVLVRRAATSALIGFGVWFVLTIFGGLILDIIARAVSPLTGSTIEEQIGQAQTQQFISRLLPGQLYSEVTAVLLDPRSNPQLDLPGSLGQAQQAAQQIPTLLAFDQSLLLVMPQVVALVALTSSASGCAYVGLHAPGGPRTPGRLCGGSSRRGRRRR